MLHGHDPAMRAATSDDDLALFARIRVHASPRHELVPPRREPDRLMLLVDDVACGLAARSDLADSVTVQVYVRPQARGRGTGSALAARLLAHAATMGRPCAFATVDGQDPADAAFARRHGLVEVGREVEAHRAVGEEPEPSAYPGVEVVTIAERPDLLASVWDAVGEQGYRDMPTPSPVAISREQWLEEEAALPEGSFVALAGDRIVGYAGMLELEHGLTVVDPAYRGRGLATHLKQRQLAWAARAGVTELVSYTQGRNDPMQRVNEKLGYVVAPPWLKMKGPLPAPPR